MKGQGEEHYRYYFGSWLVKLPASLPGSFSSGTAKGWAALLPDIGS
jgi:hypothetical protein